MHPPAWRYSRSSQRRRRRVWPRPSATLASLAPLPRKLGCVAAWLATPVRPARAGALRPASMACASLRPPPTSVNACGCHVTLPVASKLAPHAPRSGRSAQRASLCRTSPGPGCSRKREPRLARLGTRPSLRDPQQRRGCAQQAGRPLLLRCCRSPTEGPGLSTGRQTCVWLDVLVQGGPSPAVRSASTECGGFSRWRMLRLRVQTRVGERLAVGPSVAEVCALQPCTGRCNRMRAEAAPGSACVEWSALAPDPMGRGPSAWTPPMQTVRSGHFVAPRRPRQGFPTMVDRLPRVPP